VKRDHDFLIAPEYLEKVAYMLSHELNPAPAEGLTTLQALAANGFIPELTMALKHGFDPSEEKSNGVSALHYAA